MGRKGCLMMDSDMKIKKRIGLAVILWIGIVIPAWGAFEVSAEFQPNYESPQKYSRIQMERMAGVVLEKLGLRLGTPFNRRDPQHVFALAEFFSLTTDDILDIFSTPMEEADVHYFSDVESHQDKELYPLTSVDLVIRFYWEGLARTSAAQYQLVVVNERKAVHPVKSRGKVSDIATTAMFDKRPRMTIAQAVAGGKERYDVRRLINHLKVKGLSASVKQKT